MHCGAYVLETDKCLCVYTRSFSRERSLIPYYSTENITGAISSAALPLISLIIILLTYCTAICILQLERTYCQLWNSFLRVYFPSPSPHSCLDMRFQYWTPFRMQPTQCGALCPTCTIKTKSTLLTMYLFTTQCLS